MNKARVSFLDWTADSCTVKSIILKFAMNVKVKAHSGALTEIFPSRESLLREDTDAVDGLSLSYGRSSLPCSSWVV